MMDDWQIQMFVKQEKSGEDGNLILNGKFTLLGAYEPKEGDVFVCLLEFDTDRLYLFAVPAVSGIDFQEDPVILLNYGLELVDVFDVSE